MPSATYPPIHGDPSNRALSVLLGLTGASLAATSIYIGANLNLITTLGLLILAFIVALALFMGSQITSGKFDPLESGNIFLFFFALYVLSLPILTYLQGMSVSTI